MNNKRILLIARVLISLSIIFLIAIFFLKPVSDPDFWWHLKTGQWIWQHRGLPAEDPFAFTTPKLLSYREIFVLTSYWISQISYYLMFDLLGFPGLIITRVLLFGIIFYLTFLRMQRNGGTLAAFLLASAGLMVFYRLYPLDRPQVFSFVFFSIVLHLLDQLHAEDDHLIHRSLPISLSSRAAPVLLPLIMVIWANSHGGFIVGDAVLLMFAGVKIIHVFREKQGIRSYKAIASSLVAVGASMINPNTYKALTFSLEISRGIEASTISEYQSSIQVFMNGGYSITVFWILIALSLATAWIKIRQGMLFEPALLLSMGLVSFMQIRYIAFFLIASLPLLASAARNPIDVLSMRSKGLLYPVLAMILITIAAVSVPYKRNTILDKPVSEYFPEEAVDFIKKTGLKGNMYNSQEWGGYLIWKLYPDLRVFIDGRVLDASVYVQAISISNGDRSPVFGLPAWKAYLDAYHVDVVVVPIYDAFSGNILGVVNNLLSEPAWSAVFQHGNSVVFVKGDPGKKIPRNILYSRLINTLDFNLRRGNLSPALYIARGDAFFFLDNYHAAKESYLNALNLAPMNRFARQRIDELRQFSPP